jgi:hypothetical protein
MWQGVSRTKAKTQPRRKAEALLLRLREPT